MTRRNEIRWIWLLLGAVGVAARLWLWWNSLGSNDVYIWMQHAQHLIADGLVRTYKTDPAFNHPPLAGLYAAQAWRWSGPNLVNFARLLKLPGLAGEAISLWALWRFAGPRTFAIYACLPASILVSGFHGNTDCLCAALVLVAAIAFDRDHYFISGVLWSAALNVKLIPLVLLPFPVFGTHKWRHFFKLCAGLALGLLTFIPIVMSAAHAMYRNLLSYEPNLDNWGIPALLNSALQIPRLQPHFSPIEQWYVMNGRYLILGAIVCIAVIAALHRRIALTTQAALGASVFLLLASGFGVQYVEFAAPLLCYVDLAAGFWWGWTSGLFIGVVYWMFSSPRPLQSVFTSHFPGPAPLLGMLAWAVLAHFIWVHVRRVLTVDMLRDVTVHAREKLRHWRAIAAAP